MFQIICINTLNIIKISTCMCFFYKQGISLLIDALDISIQIRACSFPNFFFSNMCKNALEMIIIKIREEQNLKNMLI